MSGIKFGFNAYKSDETLESQGIVLNYGKDGKFIVARAGGANKKFAKALEARGRPYRRQIENGTVNNEVLENLLREVFVETVILGWEGVKDQQTGEDIPFSKENCLALFEQVPNLFVDLREQATLFANFRAESIEEDAKN